MPNYFVTTGAKFTPFSYERYIKPYETYKENYEKVEDEYNTLIDKASIWEKLANDAKDADVYQQYKNYADNLKSAADNLMKMGLTPEIKQSLSGMRDRYQKEIIPIEDAYNKREELIKEQKELKNKDNSIFFDIDYGDIGLRDIMNSSTPTYKYLSGNDITKKTADLVKAASNRIINDPEYNKVFNSQYVQAKLEKGYTVDEIIAAAARDKSAPQELLDIIENVKKEVDYDNWGTQKELIDTAINKGLYTAPRDVEYELRENRNFTSDLNREKLELEKDQLYGPKQPDGSRIKALGGGKVMRIMPDGTVRLEELNDDTDFDELNLSGVTGEKLEEIGYYPVQAVIYNPRRNKEEGKFAPRWQSGSEGEDIQNSFRKHSKTNLTNKRGDYSYDIFDKSKEVSVVTNYDNIPGYYEWRNSELTIDDYIAQNKDKDNAFITLMKTARQLGITDDELNSNNVIIVRAESRKQRPTPDNSQYYNEDYIIYRRR